MRRAGGLDRLQADEAADAVVDMHDQIAGRARLVTSAMKFSAALGGAARAHQAVAQDVLLADDGDVGGLEAGFDAEHGQADLRTRARSAPRPGDRGPRRD